MRVCHTQSNAGTLGIHEFDILSFNPETSGLKDGGLPITTVQQGFESLTAVFLCRNVDSLASHPRILTLRVSCLVGEGKKDKKYLLLIAMELRNHSCYGLNVCVPQ